MKYPLVSIGVPVFNSADFIVQTLKSIDKQSYPNVEVLVVDDCSTDNSYKIVMEWANICRYPIQVIRNEKNIGLTKTCNVLLNRAKGEYFQKLDSDDIVFPHKIGLQVEVMEANRLRNVAMVFSDAALINKVGNSLPESYFDRIEFKEIIPDSKEKLLQLMLKKNIVPNPSTLILTEKIKEVGGYDEDLYFEDWDLWLRILNNYNCLYNPVVTCAYRIHENSMWSDEKNRIRKNDSVVKMFRKIAKGNFPFQSIVWETLYNYTKYSFVIGDPDASNKLHWYIKQHFDFKFFVYYLMTKIGVKHHSNYF